MPSKIKIILLIPLFLLAACENEADPLAFCNKLGKAQVERIFNSSYHTAPVDFLQNSEKGCKYISDTVEGRTFNVIYHQFDYPQKAKKAFDMAVNVWQKGTFENRTYYKPANIGDEAFWSGHNEKPQLITYKETKLIILTLGGFNLGQDAQLNAAKEIAETIFNQ
jgi:hypothetical protein